VNIFGRISIAVLLSIAALLLTFVLGGYFLLLFDPHYHDGIAFGGSAVLGLVASVATFLASMKKTVPR